MAKEIGSGAGRARKLSKKEMLALPKVRSFLSSMNKEALKMSGGVAGSAAHKKALAELSTAIKLLGTTRGGVVGPVGKTSRTLGGDRPSGAQIAERKRQNRVRQGAGIAYTMKDGVRKNLK